MATHDEYCGGDEDNGQQEFEASRVLPYDGPEEMAARDPEAYEREFGGEPGSWDDGNPAWDEMWVTDNTAA